MAWAKMRYHQNEIHILKTCVPHNDLYTFGNDFQKNLLYIVTIQVKTVAQESFCIPICFFKLSFFPIKNG